MDKFSTTVDAFRPTWGWNGGCAPPIPQTAGSSICYESVRGCSPQSPFAYSAPEISLLR